jgi:integrase
MVGAQGLEPWKGFADSNPVVGTNKATDEISRDRVLSREELQLAWRNAGAGDFGAIVRLLILTGQRREEVGGMLWSEIDLDAALWGIGLDRTKNGLPHHVPLSPGSKWEAHSRHRTSALHSHNQVLHMKCQRLLAYLITSDSLWAQVTGDS